MYAYVSEHMNYKKKNFFITLTIRLEVQEQQFRHHPAKADARRWNRHTHPVKNGGAAQAGAPRELLVAGPGVDHEAKPGRGEEKGLHHRWCGYQRCAWRLHNFVMALYLCTTTGGNGRHLLKKTRVQPRMP